MASMIKTRYGNTYTQEEWGGMIQANREELKGMDEWYDDFKARREQVVANAAAVLNIPESKIRSLFAGYEKAMRYGASIEEHFPTRRFTDQRKRTELIKFVDEYISI